MARKNRNRKQTGKRRPAIKGRGGIAVIQAMDMTGTEHSLSWKRKPNADFVNYIIQSCRGKPPRHFNFSGLFEKFLFTTTAAWSKVSDGTRKAGEFRSIADVCWRGMISRTAGSAATAGSASFRNVFYLWNRINIRILREHYRPEDRVLFVNAWNDRDHGTALEPDREYGYEGLFGNTIYKDEHGKKIGESHPGFFGGTNLYDGKGHKVGHSMPGLLSGENHYDNHGIITGTKNVLFLLLDVDRNL